MLSGTARVFHSLKKNDQQLLRFVNQKRRCELKTFPHDRDDQIAQQRCAAAELGSKLVIATFRLDNAASHVEIKNGG